MGKVEAVGGCGVLAPTGRGFVQGEVLFEEAPILLIRHAAGKEKTALDSFAMTRKICEFHAGIHRLLMRLNYLQSATKHSDMGESELLLWTNASDAGPSRDGREQSGLHLAAMQFILNVIFSDPDPRNGYRMTLRTTAKILPGQEICIPYVHFEGWQSHQERQQAFLEHYHQGCKCWVYTQAGVQIVKRDARRQQILSLRDRLHSFLATRTYSGELRRDMTVSRQKVEQELGVPRPSKDACMPPFVHRNLIDA